MYEKIFREGQAVDAMQAILLPIAKDLLYQKIRYPLTIIYVPLRLCGFAYKLFEHVLGDQQYHPTGSAKNPANRMFGQFHAAQTREMKEEILKQMCSRKSVIRVVFATIAIGMGVDIPDIRHVIHIIPPCSLKAYIQEAGRAGRDGKPSTATLYYNNRDIGSNRVGIQDDMRNFCLNTDKCLRKLLLNALNYDLGYKIDPLHECCNVCQTQCECASCLHVLMEKL